MFLISLVPTKPDLGSAALADSAVPWVTGFQTESFLEGRASLGAQKKNKDWKKKAAVTSDQAPPIS